MDCVPLYTTWRFIEDMLAAVGLASIFAALCLSAAWLLRKFLDAVAVDL